MADLPSQRCCNSDFQSLSNIRELKTFMGDNNDPKEYNIAIVIIFASAIIITLAIEAFLIFPKENLIQFDNANFSFNIDNITFEFICKSNIEKYVLDGGEVFCNMNTNLQNAEITYIINLTHTETLHSQIINGTDFNSVPVNDIFLGNFDINKEGTYRLKITKLSAKYNNTIYDWNTEGRYNILFAHTFDSYQNEKNRQFEETIRYAVIVLAAVFSLFAVPTGIKNLRDLKQNR